MAGRAAPSSPAHYVVTLQGFPFPTDETFASLSGGERTAEIRRTHEGGVFEEEVSGGPATRADITVSRPYRRDRDFALAKAADAAVGRARGTIVQQPLDDDGNAYGESIVYANVLLSGVNYPDADADAGGDVARLELTFATSGPLV